MAEVWRVANLMGTVAALSLIVAVGTLYGGRWKMMRLGRRRMLSPWLIWAMGGSYGASLAFMAGVTTYRLIEADGVIVLLQAAYTLSWVSALVWLVPLTIFQLRHYPNAGPTLPPRPGGELDPALERVVLQEADAFNAESELAAQRGRRLS